MSVWLNGKKASRLFIGGKEILKAYHNNKLIFQKGNISYGWLTWMNSAGTETYTNEITLKSDYDMLSTIGNYWPSGTYFSFSSDLTKVNQIRGWEFNISPTSLVTESILPNNFLYHMPNLTGDITLPPAVKTVGNSFLAHDGKVGTIDFNMAETLGNNVIEKDDPDAILGPNLKVIGNYFLQYPGYDGSWTFAGNLDFPNLEQVGAYFFHDYYTTGTWNGSINFPKLRIIGDYFLNNHKYFNKAVSLPAAVTIGANFLGDCVGLNRPITIGPNCTTIGSILCRSAFNSTITIESNEYTCGSILSSASQFTGTFEFKANCNYTGTYFYRTAEAGGPPHYIFNCPANQITYNADSFNRGTTTAGQQQASMYYSGTYGADVIALFPQKSTSNDGNRNWVAYPNT